MRSFTINKIELPFRFSYLSIQRPRRPRVSPCEPMFAAVFVRRSRARALARSGVCVGAARGRMCSSGCRRRPCPAVIAVETGQSHDLPSPDRPRDSPSSLFSRCSFSLSRPSPSRPSVAVLHPTRALSAADAVTNYRSSGPIPTDGCPTTKIALRVHTRLPLTDPSHPLRPVKCWFYRGPRTITMTRVFLLSDPR